MWSALKTSSLKQMLRKVQISNTECQRGHLLLLLETYKAAIEFQVTPSSFTNKHRQSSRSALSFIPPPETCFHFTRSIPAAPFLYFAV